MLARNVNELGDFWVKEVSPFVKPVIEADRKGRPCPVASGVLASYDDRQFLTTAHHVTAEPKRTLEAGTLYTYLPEQIEIVGPVHRATDPLDVVDQLDLSMFEVPSGPWRYLRIPDHLAADIRQGELCFIFGYPSRPKGWQFDRERHTFQPSPLCYLGRVFRAYPTRFTVRLSRKHVHRGVERLPRLGKLNGISGGGAFVLRGDRPRLAGIVIEYHSNSAEIVCTNSVIIWSLARRICAEVPKAYPTRV
jgi:hypothetical protein